MVNTLISGVLLGVLAFVWYYVGTAVPWTSDGAYSVTDGMGMAYMVPGLGYMFFSVLAFALARGGK